MSASLAPGPGMLARPDGVRLAYRYDPGTGPTGRTGGVGPADGVGSADGAGCPRGAGPTVVFLPGFRSHMGGEKATALAAWCAARGQAMLRLDYAGHGASEGRFADGTLGEWAGDALLLLDRVPGRLVLVGSSMGGWIALLAALARPERVAALVGVAAAPDFTETMMWAAMTPPERATLRRDGVLHVPSAYGEAMPVTLRLIEEGRRHLLLGAPIPIGCPVRLLHGQADADVPWETSLRLADRLAGSDVRVTLIKDGDHRLSHPADLAVLLGMVAEVVEPGHQGA